jgi:putative transposase
LIDLNSCTLTIEHQCTLIGLSRSTFYYEPCGETHFNLLAMHLIDQIFTEHPFYGKRRMSVILKESGMEVGTELARSLMIKMGLEAIGPKPNLSKKNPAHIIYAYLLNGVLIVRINQVWSTDITYIRLENGFLYLTAVIDWYSRYILAWKLSNSLDGIFCREVLLEAIQKYGTPDIFNTDQGAQYTCLEFIQILKDNKIQISMDGRGRALDNIWIERFWRSLKYEEVYPKCYPNGREAQESLAKYFSFYNERRPHSSLKYARPGQVYRKEVELLSIEDPLTVI